MGRCYTLTFHFMRSALVTFGSSALLHRPPSTKPVIMPSVSNHFNVRIPTVVSPFSPPPPSSLTVFFLSPCVPPHPPELRGHTDDVLLPLPFKFTLTWEQVATVSRRRADNKKVRHLEAQRPTRRSFVLLLLLSFIFRGTPRSVTNRKRKIERENKTFGTNKSKEIILFLWFDLLKYRIQLLLANPDVQRKLFRLFIILTNRRKTGKGTLMNAVFIKSCCYFVVLLLFVFYQNTNGFFFKTGNRFLCLGFNNYPIVHQIYVHTEEWVMS